MEMKKRKRKKTRDETSRLGELSGIGFGRVDFGGVLSNATHRTMARLL